MSNALTVYEQNSGLEAIRGLGEILAKSGMFGTEKIEQGQVLALACMTERQSPFQILRRYHLIKGRLTVRADFALSQYRRAGGRCKWISGLTDGNEAKAHWTFQENDLETAYTIEDAKREGLIKKEGAWVTAPADMLRARLIGKTLRMIAPEILGDDPTDADPDVAGLVTQPADLGGDAEKALKAKPARAIVEVAKPPTPAKAPEPSKETAKQATGERRGTPAEQTAAAAFPEKEQARQAGIAILETAFGADENAVNFFLLQRNQITDTQTFRDVNEETGQVILARSADFIAAAKAALATFEQEEKAIATVKAEFSK